mgnify:CR=1 FL=1
MKTMPPIGSRVSYPGSKLGVIGPCRGEVVRHLSHGHVVVRVDSIPSAWPYPGDTFAPKAGDLKMEEGK